MFELVFKKEGVEVRKIILCNGTLTDYNKNYSGKWNIKTQTFTYAEFNAVEYVTKYLAGELK